MNKEEKKPSKNKTFTPNFDRKKIEKNFVISKK